MVASAAANNLWNDPARPLTGTRLSAWAHAPGDVMRTAAAARGGSTNDAVLAVLAGALRTWSTEHWPRGAGRPVPAVMMVNLRRPEETYLPGNLFTFAPVLLPCHEVTAAARLDTVIAATRGPKNPARRAAMRAITDHTPAWAFYALATRLTTPSRSPPTATTAPPAPTSSPTKPSPESTASPPCGHKPPRNSHRHSEP
jgi:hypothetical protein